MHLLLSALVVLAAISIVPTVFSESLGGDFTIPDWIKNNAGWWADGQIPDSAFLQGIQFLIKEEIIVVEIPAVESEAAEEVPGWVKNNAGWWAEDKIHDFTFVGAIKYLISQGIITVEREQQVEEPVEEAVEVNDFYMEVNGGNCCLNWGYVGKEYRFQIETFDEYRGNPVDGVEITAKIISKGGELRHDFGQVATEDGIYKNSITIPSMDWYAGNILSVTGTYNGVEKTIEKEFEVFSKQSAKSGCGMKNPFGLSDWDATPTGIAFNSDGTKMFVLGLASKNVYEYDLCKQYDAGGASFSQKFSTSGKEASPTSIAFNSDGTKMFISGFGGDDVTEFVLSQGFDLSSASYVGENCAKSGQVYTALDFNSDGTKLRILDRSSDTVHEFTLSTGFDISTCSSYSTDNDSDNLASLTGVADGKPEGMAFNDDGTKMFIVGNKNDKIYQLTLSTPYDVSAETFVFALDISDHETNPRGLEFSSDGKKMFVVGHGTISEINQYNLTTAWDISTAVHR